jgi:hypothetical protein
MISLLYNLILVAYVRTTTTTTYTVHTVTLEFCWNWHFGTTIMLKYYVGWMELER